MNLLDQRDRGAVDNLQRTAGTEAIAFSNRTRQMAIYGSIVREHNPVGTIERILALELRGERRKWRTSMMPSVH